MPKSNDPLYQLRELQAPGIVPSPVVRRRETMTAINPNDSGYPDDDKPLIVNAGGVKIGQS